MLTNSNEETFSDAVPGEMMRPAIEAEIPEALRVRLLEERLVVDKQRRKIGEVVIRKEVETRMVQIPVRSEKLIVEQIGDLHTERLAEIPLSEETVTGTQGQNEGVRQEFASVDEARRFLEGIAQESPVKYWRVRIALIEEDQL
ncbi:MAG: DUF2382 domain-containing protein [Chloroflexaceae bacterium]|nr:DUF2382 domain-containing protein [Chloroflexaceae bacterium]